jgi:DNA replication and repair protein RecF
MLTDLQVKNFRCFESLVVRLNPGFNFFVGANAEGKTSILEAVCVLLRLQSQRSATLAPLVRTGAKSFSVAGKYDTHALYFQYGGLRRKLEFDGVDQRTATDYLQIARVVSFANSDIEMVRGRSEPRRRYLDFIGSQIDPKYRPTLRAYERALRSRNALLKSNPLRLRELVAYDPPLIEHGMRLRTMRAEVVKRLAPFVGAAHVEISEGKERVDMYFAPGNSDDFAADLTRTHEQEIRLRQTMVGPHRDDIDLFVDGMNAQVYASEGQQRTLALALKIGQSQLFGESGNVPMLLLDDIFGELDPGRRHRLLASLPQGTQKLVTATAAQWPKELGRGVTFQIENREVKRES